jgi:hypothetical protein
MRRPDCARSPAWPAVQDQAPSIYRIPKTHPIEDLQPKPALAKCPCSRDLREQGAITKRGPALTESAGSILFLEPARFRSGGLPSRSAPVPVIFGNKGRSRSGGLPPRRAQVRFCFWNLRDFEAGVVSNRGPGGSSPVIFIFPFLHLPSGADRKHRYR